MRIVIGLLAACALAWAQDESKLSKARAAVVGVQARRTVDMRGRSLSLDTRQTGVIVGEDGIVLTPSLGDDVQDVRVFLPGATEAVDAEVLDNDGTFSVLKLEDEAPGALEFDAAWSPSAGQKLFWIGVLAGPSGRWTPIVKESRVDALIEDETSDEPMVYSDPPFGGPVLANGALVLNAAGDAVGLVVPRAEAAPAGRGPMRFMRRAGGGLPLVRRASSFLHYLVGQFVRRGQIGISVEPLTDKVAEALGLEGTRGAVITQITPGSGAARAGLEAQNVVTRLDGAEIASAADLQRILRGKAAGTIVKLDIVRMTESGPARDTVEVTLTEREEIGRKDRFRARRFGFVAEPLTPALRRAQSLEADVEGVHVRRVTQGSPAALARPSALRRGDVILRVGETPVADVEALKKALEAIPDGKAVAFFVRHVADTRFVEITPAAAEER